MDTTLEDLPIRDDLRGQSPYGAPQKHVRVQLNVNENTHPVPEDVAEDIVASIRRALTTVNRYPDREFTELRESLARYLNGGLSAEQQLVPAQLWAANGSNEVLQQLLQAFGGPGRTALGFTPAYSMHPIIATTTGTTWVDGMRGVAGAGGFDLDVASAVAFLASERSAYTSGCIFTIDGGLAARSG